MTCKCGSYNLIHVSGKVSDTCFIDATMVPGESDGYVPRNLNIGSGDYLEFSYCADCGRIHGEFPIHMDTIREALSEE